MEEQRAVDLEAVKEWCAANGEIPYFEVSAKDATNVDPAFGHVALVRAVQH